jgi:hypothetical protein
MPKNTYEITEAQWQSAKPEILPILINIAKRKELITYKELAAMVTSVHLEADFQSLHGILGEISEEGIQIDPKKGLLSVVVVRQEDKMPGGGFFKLAETLYETGIEDPLVFFSQELARVYENWGNERLSTLPKEHGPIPSLSYSQLQHFFTLFQQYIQESDGQPLRSFSYGKLDREEGYKSRLYEEARGILGFSNWKEGEIGSGTILEKTISAIELKENNIVKFQPRYGEDSREHKSLLDARGDKEKMNQWEKVLYHLYRIDDPLSDSAVFDEMVSLAGKRYALISYLFFLKNKRKYAPISPTNFDRAFHALGVSDFSTSHQCSWENYQTYLALISQVETFLRENMHEMVDLLDAHSFLWVVARDLVKLEVPQTRKALIPQEMKLTPVEPFKPKANSKHTPMLFDETTLLRDQKENSNTGKIAEMLVFDAEVAQLKKAGLEDLATKVKIVSVDMSLGYDIISYSSDGSEKHIEVKGTKSLGGGIFFLTANELRRSEEVPNYFLYIVTGIGTDKVSLHYVKGPNFQSGNFALEPLSYRVHYHAEK